MNDDTTRANDLTFAEFPKATREQWLALVSGVIKGAPFEKRLVSKSYDGIAIAPLYEGASGARAVLGRAAGAPGRIVQPIALPDSAHANAPPRRDSQNGPPWHAAAYAGT